MNDAEQLRRLYTLLDQALDLPETERETWLSGLTGADQTLSERLRELLRHEGVETDDFMRRPAAAQLPPLEEADAEEDGPGVLVGPFRLVEELGRGGMATVWLAEREDGGLQRQVALKLPRFNGGGLLQRMQLERDLLSALEHPNIARLYDAGVTPQGRPWLAMERVQGMPIDAYCRTHAADVPAILGLVLQACDALAHAHARLIVHRDLKPANLLVTPEGALRLVDFGVGKLLEDAAQPGRALTQLHGAAMTPDYASPEQVARRPLTVSTDVYSLGVVLYELLTGQRPYKLLRQSAAALEEAILAAEVPRASTRAAHAARARALRGDLDVILAKALEKDPARRYASVEALAADLRAHLQGHEVRAQPRSRGYRLKKFMRRNRLAVLAISATATALVLGTALAWWQALEARRQTELALLSLERAEASTNFAQSVLMEGLDADESISMRQLIDRAVAMAQRSYAGRPVEQATTALIAAGWLSRVGERPRAERLLTQALEQLPADATADTRASLHCHRGYARVRMGQVEQGVREIDETLAAGVGDPVLRGFCLHRRAAASAELNRSDDELRFMRQAVQAAEGAPHLPPAIHAQMVADLGSALWDNGQQGEGGRLFQQAFAMLESTGLGDSQASLSARHNYAIGLMHVGQPRDALAIFSAAIAREERRAPGAHIGLELLSARAEALLALAQYDAALGAFKRLAEEAQRQQHPRFALNALAKQAHANAALGRPEQARRQFEELQNQLRQPEAQQQLRRLRGTVLLLAEWHQTQGRLQDAERLASMVIDALAPSARASNTQVLALALRAELALQQQRAADATRDAQAALAAARRVQGEMPYSLWTASAWIAQAQVLAAQGQAAGAREAANEALSHTLATAGQTHPLAQRARALLALPAVPR